MPALTKYEVLEELGHGGMATVYRAHDKRLGRDVAVKVLHPHLRESREIAHRFSVEAKAVAKIRHPNIVEVFDVSSEDEEEQYLVVEFVRGQTLRKLLHQHGALPPEIAASFAVELLSALAHAHASGVVHRDVKPENVLLEHRTGAGAPLPLPSTSVDAARMTALTPIPTSSAEGRKTPQPGGGERIAIKLTDFGIAKLLDAQGVTSTGQVLGSPAHMAPEQIEGGDVDGRADVFGLGVLLYECMVGHLPFEGNNPAQVLRRVLDGIYPTAERERPVVGKSWSQILDRALARKPEGRFPDAAAMRDAISAELARLEFGAPRVELEAWFDDPEGWQEDHDRGLIERLCQLGGASRKKGDAVGAAADYNRALAYSPNDPQLLRIVSSMHRAEARMRFLRRAGPLVLGAIALGTGAFFVARTVKNHTKDDLVVASAGGTLHSAGDPSGAPSSKPPLDAKGVASIDPKSGAVTTVSANVPRAPGVPVPGPSDKVLILGKVHLRTVTIASIRPLFGVTVAIDDEAPREVRSGEGLSLDDKAHKLTFACAKSMCKPQVISVSSGTGDERHDVAMQILPATLVVEGEPTHSYGIEGIALGTTLGTGIPTEVPMNAGTRDVSVFDQANPEKKKTATLRAGEKTVVSFKGI